MMADLASAQKAPRRKEPKELAGKPRVGLKPKRRGGWKETPTRMVRAAGAAEPVAAEAGAEAAALDAPLPSERQDAAAAAGLVDGPAAAASAKPVAAPTAAAPAGYAGREKDAYVGPGTKGMIVYFGILGAAGLAVIVLNLVS